MWPGPLLCLFLALWTWPVAQCSPIMSRVPRPHFSLTADLHRVKSCLLAFWLCHVLPQAVSDLLPVELRLC